MTRTSIEIESFVHENPIPAATKCGPLIESSIIPSFNDGVREWPDTIEEQIDNLFLHMGNMLTEADATWDDMVKVTFFVTGSADLRSALNGPWAERFPDPASRPSRHTMQLPNSPSGSGSGDGPARISCVFTAYIDR